MADYAAIIGAGISLIGGIKESSDARKQQKAQYAAEERLAKLAIQAQKDADREKFQRERELWSKAMSPYAGFSRSPSLQGLSQMNTPYTTVDSPGLSPNG